MGLLRVALRFEFENPVVLVHSCVHDRLRPREMIGSTVQRQFSVSVSDSKARLWLNSRSVVCDRFELYLRWRNIGKC